ncbi:N-6 DNA methylase [Brucella sp. TWI559]
MVNISNIKTLLQSLGFTLDNGAIATWTKSYPNHANYKIEVDVPAENIDYGAKIKTLDKTTCNFKAAENFVVLECVNRLLEKGYKPENIILEKKWATGHGTSGKLDILVTRDNRNAHMMIECKTFGTEFDKAFKRIQKDGGQLFTYFQQDKCAEILMLYASECTSKGKIAYQNEIIKIEEDYRQTSNVNDFYERWIKLTKNNGVFEEWVKPYDFKSRALTPRTLEDITQKDSSFIFNQFLEILRHNVVSDKPNAFNKIFTLFLCKIYDEKVTRPDEELAFQWFYNSYTYDGISYAPDDHISFQKRLTDLYKKGMKEFLDKEVTDISDAEFEKKYANLSKNIREKLLEELVDIRLKKNNEFAFKEVYDNESFEENAKVVKEVVELLQGYKIRYTKKQQYLSDFFEMLLTTGLKQESGQFFTPVPIAQFIIKSLPLDMMVKEKLQKGETGNYLPTIIDYAAGSGHFITEGMHEVQNVINSLNSEDYISDTAKKIKSWKADHFDWAYDYVYGIEKDYRLVKVGKVGCYLHGDGLAQIIHSDGLGDFDGTQDYKGILRKTSKDNAQENRQFDIVISNPPYSVSAFKNNASKYYGEKDFELYNALTDQSSEIECLFIERTKQLLKDGGLAGIVLPSSILSNTGIYTKAREIILKYFDIVGIAELGSNTFMATGTNTVTLFLRRRDNYAFDNIFSAVVSSFDTQKDNSINRVQAPIRKYVEYVWDGLSIEDYWSLLSKSPNINIKNHEVYKNYNNRIRFNDEDGLIAEIISREIEKVSYFILATGQKVVIVKSGEKKEEKEFLGYEFSNRRGNEGIHPIHRGQTIEECTKLFDPNRFDNPVKASTYLYMAFTGDFETSIDTSLQNNISRHNLVDMMTFDRDSFDKTLSLSVKKKVEVEGKWPLIKLRSLIVAKGGDTFPKKYQGNKDQKKIPFFKVSDMNIAVNIPSMCRAQNYVSETETSAGLKATLVNQGSVVFPKVGQAIHTDKKRFLGQDSYIDNNIMAMTVRDETTLSSQYLFWYFISRLRLSDIASNANPPSISAENLYNQRIPLPPLEIQLKIVSEISTIEERERQFETGISDQRQTIFDSLRNIRSEGKLSDLCRIRKKTLNPQDYMSTAFVNIGLEDIEAQTGKILSQDKILGEKILSVKNIFKKDDVLYGKLRPYLNKVAIAATDGICSTDILVLQTKIPSVLKYILLSSMIVEQTSRLVGGLRMPRIKPDDLMNLTVQIPNDKEKREIIALIEKAEIEIAGLQYKIEQLSGQKDDVLAKYL